MRRTVPPSAEIQASIDKLMSKGMVDDPQKMLSELARLGARLIIQRAVEDEFDQWLGRARYERRPEAGPGKRNGFRPRHLQTGEGELRIEIPQVRQAAIPFVSKLFPKWHCKRLLRTDPLKALVIGGFVRGLSMRDVESLCEEAGLGRTSKSTVATICAELHERFEAFGRRSLYDVNLVVLFLDAIYLPVRPSGPKEGVICAWGITENGSRELVSVCLGARESKEDWLELGRDLISRGLAAPRLVVADGAPGLISAVEEIWPRARSPALRRSPTQKPAGETPEVRAGPGPVQLLVGAARSPAGKSRKDPKPGPQVRIRAPRLRVHHSVARCRADDADRAVAFLDAPSQQGATRDSPNTLSGRGAEAPQRGGASPRRTAVAPHRLGRGRTGLPTRPPRRTVTHGDRPHPVRIQVPPSRPRPTRRGGPRQLTTPKGNCTGSDSGRWMGATSGG